MKHLMKGIRIAAYIAEIIVAGSTIVELLEKVVCREVWQQKEEKRCCK